MSKNILSVYIIPLASVSRQRDYPAQAAARKKEALFRPESGTSGIEAIFPLSPFSYAAHHTNEYLRCPILIPKMNLKRWMKRI